MYTVLSINPKVELLFGRESHRKGDDIYFAPERVFGIRRRQRRSKEITILRSCGAGQEGHTLAHISPGAEILLRVRATWADALYRAFKEMESEGIILARIEAEDFLALNSRFFAKLPVRPMLERWREKYRYL